MEKELEARAATFRSSDKASGGSNVRTITNADFFRSRDESLDKESSLFNIGDDLVTSLKDRAVKAYNTAGRTDLSAPEAMLQIGGQGAGAISDVAGAALKGVYHTLVPEAGKKTVRRWGREILNTDIGQAGMEALHKGMDAWEEFKQAHPDAAADLSSVVNIAGAVADVAGAKSVKSLAEGAVSAVKNAPGAAKNLAVDTLESAGKLYKGAKKGLFGETAQAAEKGVVQDAAETAARTADGPLSDAARASDMAAEAEAGVDTAAQEAAQANRTAVQRAAGNFNETTSVPPTVNAADDLAAGAMPEPPAAPKPNLEQTGEKIGRYFREKAPNLTRNVQGGLERRAPNIAAQKAETAAYDALKPEAQKAVRNGLLRRDVEAFTSGNDKERSILKDMVKAAEDNTNNRGTTHPSDLVGKEMNRRIKLLDDERKVVGKELGEHVRGLKTKDLGGIEQVQQDVLERLNEVPGLEGIKTTVDDAGKTVLDFSDTAMSGSQTESARKELQAIWDDMANKNPYQLHRQRQELFEALGGKKAAQLQLTETQEQGMDAVREGIADSLERVSQGYKDLNGKYRQIVTPLREMRKFYKGTEGAAEDVLDAKAGLLARRLTSNVASAPELRRILDEIGSQLAKRGKDVSDVDLNKLQDMYNALNRYYDITKDTTFEGLIKSANANPTEFTTRGIAKRVIDAAAKNTYITKDTQRAAIKELLGL